MKLILPVAGKSSRFNGSKPKYLLRHPEGGIMLTAAIAQLPLNSFDEIYVVCLKEHLERFPVRQQLKEALLPEVYAALHVMTIEESLSQPHTVAQALDLIGGDFSFLVKDCDNTFGLDMPLNEQQADAVVCALLEDYPEVRAANKSYLTTYGHQVVNLAEKKVISDRFCVGGYFFASSKYYLSVWNKVPPEIRLNESFHLSHLIYRSIMEGRVVETIGACGYEDWGTQQDWERYCDTFATLFVDVDGVLVENAATDHSPYPGETRLLTENVAFLKSQKRLTLVFTTSRPEKFRSETVAQLQAAGLKYHTLLMGLPHARRVAVNDHRPGEAYRPSAIGISLPRDSNELKQALRSYGIGVHHAP